MDKIININNYPVVILEQLKDLGPENHYKCLYKNKEEIIALQPSGVIVFYTVDKYNHVRYGYKAGECTHRECGPAAWYLDGGTKYWVFKYQKHREDGPAVEYSNGNKTYYLLDIRIDEKDFERCLKLYKKEFRSAKNKQQS